MQRRVTPKHYVPSHLTRKDRARQRREIAKSKRLYREGKYYTRRKVRSFRSKKSSHTQKAKAIYEVDRITANPLLAKKTGCSVKALRTIVKKGMGAYYSSGSRPNQTAQSWGRARLASAITGGPSARVDMGTLKRGCKKTGKALRLARKSFPKN
jgi:hypothetical protein